MTNAASTAPQARPWKLGLAWLMVLGPFFFASYGFSNWAALQRDSVSHVVFAWERAIPFIPWTIVPYWLIDALYAGSLFLCITRKSLLTHVRRLLAAQVIAVACFLVFPLRFSFEKPAVEGFPGWMFVVLTSFDQPFNQAPSLHIALLVILWGVYLRSLPRWAHVWIHLAGALIGVSVLTTWQHHFIDVPTGAWLGAFCAWLFPDAQPSPLAAARLTQDVRRLALARNYAIAALCLGGVAFARGGALLWLLWPMGSLLLVASCYACLGEAGFQKRADGTMSLPARWLLWPYLAGAALNARWWTRRIAPAHEIHPGVWLGRLPNADDAGRVRADAIVDLCAELPCGKHVLHYTAVPMLDLTVPSSEQIEQAAAAIDRNLSHGRVLVCCALGFSRSALACAAWLVRAGVAASIDEAVGRVRAVRTQIVLDGAHLEALRRWASEHDGRRGAADAARGRGMSPMPMRQRA